MEIESYTSCEDAECTECDRDIIKGDKRFQVVTGKEIEGPFCSESCIEKYQKLRREAEFRANLYGASEDLLAACKAMVEDYHPDKLFAIQKMARAAVAKVEGD